MPGYYLNIFKVSVKVSSSKRRTFLVHIFICDHVRLWTKVTLKKRTYVCRFIKYTLSQQII